MSWRHRDILEAELHEPKGFTTANNGDSIWKNEEGVSEWTDREVLPAALNFVDASVTPPTTVSGDIYVLSLGASIHANWGTVALKDWVRYDGTSWNVITPSKSILCYDKTLDVLMSYDGSVWSSIGGGGGGEVNTSSNSGAGEGLALTKVGSDLPFKSITAGTGITLTSSASELQISSSGGDNISNANLTFDATYFADLNGNDWSIKNGGNSYLTMKSDGELVLGYNAYNLSTSSQKNRNTVIGNSAKSTASNSSGTVAIGYNSSTSSSKAVAIGQDAGAIGSSSIAILGYSNRSGAIAIGDSSQAIGNNYSIAIGKSAVAMQNKCIALGNASLSSGVNSMALGYEANSTSISSLSLGRDTRSLAVQGITVGTHLEVTHSNSIILGSGVNNATGSRLSSTNTNELVIGFDSITPTMVIGATSDSYIKSTGNLSLETNTTVKGSDTSVSTIGFKVTDSANTSLLEVKNSGLINASNLPTSASGLSSGDIWNNSGVLNIV